MKRKKAKKVSKALASLLRRMRRGAKITSNELAQLARKFSK